MGDGLRNDSVNTGGCCRNRLPGMANECIVTNRDFF